MSSDNSLNKNEPAPVQVISAEERIKQLETQLQAECKKSETMINTMKYLQADFENYKKRVDKELADTKLFVGEKLITNLLDVVDEFELALRVAKSGGNHGSLAGGVEMTLKKLLEVLAKEGLSRIKTKDRKFDPNFHEATEIVPTKDMEEGIIVAEIRAGYMLRDKVLRPSMVRVASPPA